MSWLNAPVYAVLGLVAAASLAATVASIVYLLFQLAQPGAVASLFWGLFWFANRVVDMHCKLGDLFVSYMFNS
jgi:hypothetical protein